MNLNKFKLTNENMVKYYTYRLKELPTNLKEFEIQDLPIDLMKNDNLIVFLAGSLDILGLYKVSNEKIVIETKIDKMKLSDFYDCFSFITEVGDRTYKMFAKPVREIEKEDYERVKKKV